MNFRPEYVKLGTDLPRVARGFGVELSEQTCRDTLLLALAMDRLDDRVDALCLRSEREEIYAVIMRGLQGEETEFGWVLAELSGSARRLGVVEPLSRTVARLLELGEELRVEREGARYVALGRLEADLTVNMLFLMLGPQPRRLLAFLHRSGVIGNLMDKLIDLSEDRREGRASVGLSAGFAAAWLREVGWAAAQIPFLHPRPLALLGYTWSWLRFEKSGAPRDCESLRERCAPSAPRLPPPSETAGR